MKRHRAWVAVALLYGVTSACASPTSLVDEQALRRAEARWAAGAFDSYSYETVTSCGECAPEVTRPTRVVVRGGVVSAAIVIASDSPLPTVASFTTVDGLFAQIRAYQRESWAQDVQVEYDPQLGYPTTIDVRVKAGIQDGDYRKNIRGLVRLP